MVEHYINSKNIYSIVQIQIVSNTKYLQFIHLFTNWCQYMCNSKSLQFYLWEKKGLGYEEASYWEETAIRCWKYQEFNFSTDCFFCRWPPLSMHWSKRIFMIVSLKPNIWIKSLHIIIHIHNNFMRNWQYFAKYSTIQVECKEYFA